MRTARTTSSIPTIPGGPAPATRRSRRGVVGSVAVLAAALFLSACGPILLPDGTPLPPNPVASRNGRVGMNVSYVADWSTELPFVDVVKSGRPWTPNQVGRAWGLGDALALDANGWITQLSPGQYGTLVLLNVQGRFPAGRYTLLYDGNGTLQLDPHAVTVLRQDPGRWEVQIGAGASSGGVMLNETATDPADPVRNIRLIMPGYEATYQTQPFNPTFLRTLQPFNVLRFLWWMRTSSQSAPGAMVNWSDRTTRTYAFQSNHGVALEYMIDLANQLDVDPWFTLPHDAGDDYVRQFATMVRNRLKPSLRAWVEYSNETWNGVYPQAAYVQQQGTALGLSTDPYQAGLFFHARRALEMFAIWENVFGGHSRFVRVLAAQGGNPWTGRQVVAAAGGSAHADVIAIAPYFGCVRPQLSTAAGAAQIEAMTDDQIMDGCAAEIDTDTRSMITQYHDLAVANGLQLVAYEGGQHMVGLGPEAGDPVLATRLNQANRAPRMHEIYNQYYALWKSIGGAEFVDFASVGGYSQYGSFGKLEWQDQDPRTAPKYLAAVEAAR